jgi:hypothetical protein
VGYVDLYESVAVYLLRVSGPSIHSRRRGVEYATRALRCRSHEIQPHIIFSAQQDSLLGMLSTVASSENENDGWEGGFLAGFDLVIEPTHPRQSN